jgi:Uma2 family endonuclease
VLSPTSLERDLVAKLHDYDRAGLDHYWVVDPEAPQLAVYGRRDGVLTLTDLVNGDDALVATQPLELQLRASDLVR